jgi:hypothetical protein
MANIKVKNLEDFNTMGISLFDDSENLMIEMNDDGAEQLTGGCALTLFVNRTRDDCSVYSCFVSHPPALTVIS